jgi:hypothetical protein
MLVHYILARQKMCLVTYTKLAFFLQICLKVLSQPGIEPKSFYHCSIKEFMTGSKMLLHIYNFLSPLQHNRPKERVAGGGRELYINAT